MNGNYIVLALCVLPWLLLLWARRPRRFWDPMRGWVQEHWDGSWEATMNGEEYAAMIERLKRQDAREGR